MLLPPGDKREPLVPVIELTSMLNYDNKGMCLCLVRGLVLLLLDLGQFLLNLPQCEMFC